MKSQTIKNAKLFIIPNGACHKSNLCLLKDEKAEDSLWAKQAAQWCEELGTNFDIETDAMVQIWICDDNHDNLTSHIGDDVRMELYGKTYDDFKFNKCMPGYCPARLLEGKKEGDHITFTFPTGVTVECELCQLGYRYRRWGRFEDVFDYVVPGKFRKAS